MSNYITVEEAQEYADERLNVEAWDTAKETDGSSWGEAGTLCVKAITMATKAIDRLSYKGDKYSSTQENQFPRGTDTTVPDDIKRACMLTFEIQAAQDRIIDIKNSIPACEKLRKREDQTSCINALTGRIRSLRDDIKEYEHELRQLKAA